MGPDEGERKMTAVLAGGPEVRREENEKSNPKRLARRELAKDFSKSLVSSDPVRGRRVG